VFELENRSSHESWLVKEGQSEARGNVSDMSNLDNEMQIAMQSIQRGVTP